MEADSDAGAQPNDFEFTSCAVSATISAELTSNNDHVYLSSLVNYSN